MCEVTALTAFMDQLQQHCQFEKWFFGAYHQDRVVPPKYHGLFEEGSVGVWEEGRAFSSHPPRERISPKASARAKTDDFIGFGSFFLRGLSPGPCGPA